MPEIVILARGGSMHHARPIIKHFKERSIIEADWRPSVIAKHKPDLVITFDEHGCELGLCVAEMSRQGVATLQVMDGILEWRRTWAYPTSFVKRPINQPVLSHKVACLGNADARIMESWGNVGKCEIVGSPRFDPIIELKRDIRTDPVTTRPMRLLIMTAKTPGFTPEQLEVTYKSLVDLKDHLKSKTDIEVIWRVTQKLHQRLGVNNTVKDVTSTELHDILRHVDAVITTPSTAMLESMLFGHPVALLDYHNCPHYIPAAWRVTSEEQIGTVVEDLRNPPLDRMLYQEYCLNDALSSKTPALPRMIKLIENMIRVRRINGKKIHFPYRILDNSEDHVSWPSESFDLEKLYPDHSVFGRKDITSMQAELEAALGTIDMLKNQVNILTKRLNKIPGYKLASTAKKILRKLV